MIVRAIPDTACAMRSIARAVDILCALHCCCPSGPVVLHNFQTFEKGFLHVSGDG